MVKSVALDKMFLFLILAIICVHLFALFLFFLDTVVFSQHTVEIAAHHRIEKRIEVINGDIPHSDGSDIEYLESDDELSSYLGTSEGYQSGSDASSSSAL